VKFARDRHGIANRVISNPFLGPPPAATAPPLPMQEAVLQPPPLQAAMPSVQSVGWHGLPMSRRDYLLGMPHANHPMAQQQMYGAAQHIHPSQHAASSVFYAAAGGGGVAHAMGCCSAAGCGCSGNFPSAATASSVGLAPAHGPGPAQEVSDSSPFPMPAGMWRTPSANHFARASSRGTRSNSKVRERARNAGVTAAMVVAIILLRHLRQVEVVAVAMLDPLAGREELENAGGGVELHTPEPATVG
jgi:hypothetical protein